MFRIMVVEDDCHTRKLMKAVLEQNGYEPVLAQDGLEALELLDRVQIDLILLDVMMPRMDGYEFTEVLRSGGCNIPILMVTAKEALSDKKRGFVMGIDDYMVKPVDEEEMLLRISAILRRSNIMNEHKLTIGASSMNYEELSITINGIKQELPNKEFLLLFKLLSYPNKIFTRRQLMDELWSMDSDTDERTVDVHINRLRERLKNNEDFEIATVRGLGYKAVKL